jgi:hypothetical protein
MLQSVISWLLPFLACLAGIGLTYLCSSLVKTRQQAGLITAFACTVGSVANLASTSCIMSGPELVATLSMAFGSFFFGRAVQMIEDQNHG